MSARCRSAAGALTGWAVFQDAPVDPLCWEWCNLDQTIGAWLLGGITVVWPGVIVAVAVWRSSRD